MKNLKKVWLWLLTGSSSLKEEVSKRITIEAFLEKDNFSDYYTLPDWLTVSGLVHGTNPAEYLRKTFPTSIQSEDFRIKKTSVRFEEKLISQGMLYEKVGNYDNNTNCALFFHEVLSLIATYKHGQINTYLDNTGADNFFLAKDPMREHLHLIVCSWDFRNVAWNLKLFHLSEASPYINNALTSDGEINLITRTFDSAS